MDWLARSIGSGPVRCFRHIVEDVRSELMSDLQFTRHARQRMVERGIREQEVWEAITHGDATIRDKGIRFVARVGGAFGAALVVVASFDAVIITTFLAE